MDQGLGGQGSSCIIAFAPLSQLHLFTLKQSTQHFSVGTDPVSLAHGSSGGQHGGDRRVLHTELILVAGDRGSAQLQTWLRGASRLRQAAKYLELYVKKPAMQQLSSVFLIWVSKAWEQYWHVAC